MPRDDEAYALRERTRKAVDEAVVALALGALVAMPKGDQPYMDSYVSRMAGVLQRLLSIREDLNR